MADDANKNAHVEAVTQDVTMRPANDMGATCM
jgi:hypothetical protein